MGSKSGRKRRRREQQQKAKAKKKPAPAPKTPTPEVDPALDDAAGSDSHRAGGDAAPPPEPAHKVTTRVESPAATTAKSDHAVVAEKGPVWTPPAGAPPPTAADTPDGSPPDVPLAPLPLMGSAKPPRSGSPRTASVKQASEYVLYGAHESLDAIHRLETRVDRLTEWLGGFSAWYQHAAMAQADLEGRRDRRRRLLVFGMMIVFAPIIILGIVAIRSGWF